MKRTQRKKIIAARRGLRYSIVELAKITGLSYQTLIGIEKGYRAQLNPTVPTRVKIARALKIDVKELL